MNLYLKLWSLSMLLCSALSLILYYAAGMRHSFIRKLFALLVLTQIADTVLAFSGLYQNSPLWKYVFLFCLAASLAAFPSLCFIAESFAAQYHRKIKNAIYAEEADYKKIVPGEKTTVYETKDLYIFFPEYKTVHFIVEKPPKKRDRSVTWCSAAAYQHELQRRFSPDNIEGCHASLGRYYEGAPMPPHKYGAFVFYDGKYAIDFDEPEKAVKTAADHGGDGFLQAAVIVDGRPAFYRLKMVRERCFRVLAELNGNLCIIDGKKKSDLLRFVDMLVELGVSNALYLDVGAICLSWYRKANGRVKMLFKLKLPWGKNWLIFRK